MGRPVAMPHGAWPLEMRAVTAAAYCDEPSVQAFLAKVSKGIYSQPTRTPNALPKWHRGKLDRDIAKRHGLELPESDVIDDVESLI